MQNVTTTHKPRRVKGASLERRERQNITRTLRSGDWDGLATHLPSRHMRTAAVI